ncbi:hypothetical protein EDD11_000572 [Mortierella claussenii]|nr:hypothetical protein EDD11_000572 [Mortierella claussenii]
MGASSHPVAQQEENLERTLRHKNGSSSSGHPSAPAATEAAVVETDKFQSNHERQFSLRSWVRNAPWSQYFKDGCRLIVKSPLNFFIFICCLSVVIWGAFLVLLMGNLVKLADNATQKLWIEIASQVLNGFFTLANVPVHPKRLLGLVQGYRIWSEDSCIRRQFIDQFLGQSTGEQKDDLLRRLDFYRCFPGYGRQRKKESFTLASFDESMASATPVTKVVVSTSRARSRSRSRSSCRSQSRTRSIDWQDAKDASGHLNAVASGDVPILSSTIVGKDKSSSQDIAASEAAVRVDIAEAELHELLAEETHRVVQSVVLPFMPFPLEASDATVNSNMDTTHNRQFLSDTDVAMQQMEEGAIGALQTSPASPRSQRTLDRGRSFASLSRVPTKRPSPRTRARTTTMSMARGSDVSAFVVHENQHLPQQAIAVGGCDIHGTHTQEDSTLLKHSEQDNQPSPPIWIPMPLALTVEQMDWIDERQASLLQRQDRLQKAWPWYNYTIPAGIEPVDFFAPPADQKLLLSEQSWAPAETSRAQPSIGTKSTPGHGASVASKHDAPATTILLSTSPSELVISSTRFCLIVGSFNINSMVQEVLCGFMWGMNYHVRPGWVVGTGMALGCIAAIVPSILIMLHEQRMSRMRVVAAAEEAIQDALDGKKAPS